MNKISEYSLHVPPKQQTLNTDIANGMVSAWDDLVSTVRWTQKQMDKIPVNKWSGGATAALLLSAVVLDRTGQSQVLLGEHFGAASDMLSGITSVSTTSLINLGTFLNYNFWEDIVGYDLIGGGTVFRRVWPITTPINTPPDRPYALRWSVISPSNHLP
ncbi:MAG: hypothetical protein R3D66_00260 [Alphaproteobacteria bacterium]